MLWFDVESRYEATIIRKNIISVSCGLMQNQDMKQHGVVAIKSASGCGLMQNQDMKQRAVSSTTPSSVVV